MASQVSLINVVIVTSAAALAASRWTASTFSFCFFSALPIALSSYLLFWSWLYPFYFSPLRHIPTVPGFPLWGQFREIVTSEVGVPQRQWHKQHGLMIRYFFPFGSERLSIAEDSALHHMTIKNAYNYPKPVRAKLWMTRILGDGVLLAEGNEHVRQRKALNPAFSVQNIRALTPWFWRKALHLADLWQADLASTSTKSKSFEVVDWLNRTTLDIIGEAAFGAHIDSLDHNDAPLREAYKLVFSFDFSSRLLHGLQAFIPASKHIPAKMNADMQTSREIIVAEASRIVESKYEDSEEQSRQKDIMSLIARDNQKTKARGEHLSMETMRDQIMTFLGAGHDTTATGIAWTLHLLARRPEIQQKLREEIRQHAPVLFNMEARAEGSDRFEDIDVDQLPYLDNVCRESLRYIPPIPMTVREALADDTLAGYHIPKGTTVYILANAINRLPQYWGETADEFDPERWGKLPPTHSNNAYMTFLQGTRGCIGRKFAETEMKVILCSLLSMFDFKPREDLLDPEDWKMWRLVLKPKDGITLDVTPLAEM